MSSNLNLSSLDGWNGFQINGEVVGDNSGNSVSFAGDINGDGLDDLIIGAPDADPNGTSSGISYVVFGKTGGFAANLDLSSLNGSTGFRISGEAEGDESGTSVSSAGDVNGDGLDDLIIGAPRAEPNGTNSGASYVIFGKAGGFAANLDLSSLNGSTGFQISGEVGVEWNGEWVSSAGDLNGDGFGDLVIGAPGSGPTDTYKGTRYSTYPGTSYVVFGKAGGFVSNLELSSLNGSTGFKITGEVVGDESGTSVSSAGDVNGDGFDDLIIGAPGAGGNYTGGDYGAAGDLTGASYVVFGKAGGFAANLDLSSLNGRNGFQMKGEARSDMSGTSVSSAGDVNGDGFDDLIIGAPWADPNGTSSGTSYVVFGKTGGFAANLDLSSLNGSTGFRISGEAEGDESGTSVSSAGDVNGDGLDDLIIGAPWADPNGTSSGTSYVVFGKTGGFAANLDLSNLNGRNGFQISGEAGFDFSGTSVSSAGDVNSDGFDDLIIGNYWTLITNSTSGASYVVFGKPTVSVNRTGTAAAEVLTGSDFADWIVGQGGADHISGNRGSDTLFGSGGFDNISGGGGSDKLYGGAGGDRLYGKDGSDVLRGGAGNDILRGGIGGDFIAGNAGRDALFAGSIADARDTFSFAKFDSNSSALKADRIFQFDRKNGAAEAVWDRVDLSSIDADNELGGDQKFRFVEKFTMVGSSTPEGQVRIQDLGADVNVRIDFDGDSTTDMVIRVMGVGTLSAADFLL